MLSEPTFYSTVVLPPWDTWGTSDSGHKASMTGQDLCSDLLASPTRPQRGGQGYLSFLTAHL